MPHIPLKYAPKLVFYGTKNYFTSRPLVISFEVTLSCNANCKHCDLGGRVKDEKRLDPEELANIYNKFKSPVIQISGGEPLLRPDIVEVIKKIKHNKFFPYTILVTNGWLLNRERFLKLKEAGVNQFSVSLDFPDERHDEFRVMKGLFKRLSSIIPQLAKDGGESIVLNTAITSLNVRELPKIVETANKWGVCISFSVYTPLRTNDESLRVTKEEDIKFLEDIFKKCKRKEGIYKSVVNSPQNLDGLMQFVKDGEIPNCQSGRRFFVVRPEGLLNPCSLHRINFSDQKSMIKKFTNENKCGKCYVSIRSYVEVSFLKLLWENISLRVLNSN